MTCRPRSAAPRHPRHLAPLAPPTHRQTLDPTTPETRKATSPRQDPVPHHRDGHRQPHLGLPPHPRRTHQPRPPHWSIYRLEDPQRPRHQPGTKPQQRDVEPVPTIPNRFADARALVRDRGSQFVDTFDEIFATLSREIDSMRRSHQRVSTRRLTRHDRVSGTHGVALEWRCSSSWMRRGPHDTIVPTTETDTP
jgi:hypothetical protein